MSALAWAFIANGIMGGLLGYARALRMPDANGKSQPFLAVCAVVQASCWGVFGVFKIVETVAR
jgi:hypothetical protein